MAEESYWISKISDATTMVHVGHASAYQAFTEGKRLFDVSTNGELIAQFKQNNNAEFGHAFEENTITYPGWLRIRVLLHKYAATEAMTPELQTLEQELDS